MSSYYETETILMEYLFFHYGEEQRYCPFPQAPREALGFPQRVVERALLNESSIQFQRALDLGCAVGRSSFELSRYFQNVIGIDYSSAFIEKAQKIQKQGTLEIQVLQEMGSSTTEKVSLPLGVKSERVRFMQGDAMNLAPDLQDFDFILAANLIDRIPSPRHFLEKIISRLKPGGLLALTSPYTWMETFTPRSEWLNQREGNFQAISKILSPQVDFVKKEDLPFLIREHRRKYQWSVAELSVWRKSGL